MKTITLEEVQSAYTKHNLTPMRGDWFPNEGCACGIAVLFYKYMCKLSRDRYIIDIESVNRLGYTTDYINGFVCGFESYPLLYENIEEYKQGYTDGKRIGIALLGDKNV